MSCDQQSESIARTNGRQSNRKIFLYPHVHAISRNSEQPEEAKSACPLPRNLRIEIDENGPNIDPEPHRHSKSRHYQ